MPAAFYFGVSGTQHDVREEFAMADNDAPRILVYLMASEFGKVTENVVTQVPDASWSPADGQTEADRPTVAVQSWVTRQAAPEEAARNYAKFVFDNLRAAAVELEKANAAAAAMAAIPPIEVI